MSMNESGHGLESLGQITGAPAPVEQNVAVLRERKVENLERTRPDMIAAGNLGCMTQIAAGTDIPVVHTVELLDWAYGGPVPRGLEGLETFSTDVPGPGATAEDYIRA